MNRATLLILGLCSLTFSSPAWAEGAIEAFVEQEASWPELSQLLYEDRTLHDGAQYIAIDSPYRTDNDARTRIAAQVVAPANRVLESVTLILDENPMPVSAVFKFDKPLSQFSFDVTMRINGPTPLHMVAKTSDGELFVAETFVKTSGQGACAAPPGTDPEEALATLGQMFIGTTSVPYLGASSASLRTLALHVKQIDVDILHPSHSGMQMDQTSLLYIPMRYVQNIRFDVEGEGYVDMTGSISLSENPRVSVVAPKKAQTVDITMTDSSGAVTHARKALSLPGYTNLR